MLCGARNLDYCNENYQDKLLTSLLRTYDLLHIVNFATGNHNGLITAIDNIFVHNIRLNSSFTSAIAIALSDHDCPVLTMNNI